MKNYFLGTISVGLLKLHYLEHHVSVKSKSAHPPSPKGKPLYSVQFDAKQGLLGWAFGCRQNVGQWSQATSYMSAA